MEYPKEQVWKIYEQLPDELKDAIFSEETAENISNVCAKNGVTDPEKVSEIARLAGNVLLGLFPPDEFQDALEQELKLEKDIAKKISFGIQRFIFYPVKTSLSALYQMDITSGATPSSELRASPIKESRPRTEPTKDDTYREQIGQ